MAEQDYATYDKYRTDLADFRTDMAQFRKEVRAELSSMRNELSSMRAENITLRAEVHKAIGGQTKWLAGLVLLAAGAAIAVAKLL